METIEQAKNRLEITIDGRNGFFRGVLWANKWISVEDELPGEEFHLKEVLCKIDHNNGYIVVLWSNASKRFLSKFDIKHENEIITGISHWRPIEII